jgi:hypothetical protein
MGKLRELANRGVEMGYVLVSMLLGMPMSTGHGSQRSASMSLSVACC